MMSVINLTGKTIEVIQQDKEEPILLYPSGLKVEERGGEVVLENEYTGEEYTQDELPQRLPAMLPQDTVAILTPLCLELLGAKVVRKLREEGIILAAPSSPEEEGGIIKCKKFYTLE